MVYPLSRTVFPRITKGPRDNPITRRLGSRVQSLRCVEPMLFSDRNFQRDIRDPVRAVIQQIELQNASRCGVRWRGSFEPDILDFHRRIDVRRLDDAPSRHIGGFKRLPIQLLLIDLVRSSTHMRAAPSTGVPREDSQAGDDRVMSAIHLALSSAPVLRSFADGVKVRRHGQWPPREVPRRN